jgi:hypothetical protein
MALLFACGLLIFIWGLFEFLFNSNKGNEKEMGGGKKHMLWGILGMFIMVASYGIVKFIASFFSYINLP